MRSAAAVLSVLSLARSEAAEKRSTVSSSPWACSPLTLGATSMNASAEGWPLPGGVAGISMDPDAHPVAEAAAGPADWTLVKTGAAGVLLPV